MKKKFNKMQAVLMAIVVVCISTPVNAAQNCNDLQL